MLTKTDLTKLYDTLLSIPGMNEMVKIDFKIPRKNVLLLSKIIERGMNPGGTENGASILDIASSDTLDALSKLSEELLEKGGLTDMNEKLKSF